MKKLTPFLLTGLLMFGAVACANNEKTAQNAPDNTNQAQTQTPTAQNVQDAQKDATSQTRRDQLNWFFRTYCAKLLRKCEES